jgi:hypothetical protein
MRKRNALQTHTAPIGRLSARGPIGDVFALRRRRARFATLTQYGAPAAGAASAVHTSIVGIV